MVFVASDPLENVLLQLSRDSSWVIIFGITLFINTPLQMYSEGLRFLYVLVVFLGRLVFGLPFLDFGWMDIISDSTDGTAGRREGDDRMSVQGGKTEVWFTFTSCGHWGVHTDDESSLITLMVSNADQGVGSIAAAIFVIMDRDSADRCIHSSSLSMFNRGTIGGDTVEESPCFEIGSKAQSSGESLVSVESFHSISSREKRISPVE